MESVKTGIEMIQSLVDLLKSIKESIIPNYKETSKDLQEVLERIISANEKLLKWIYKFTDFDFEQENAKKVYHEFYHSYQAIKQGKRYYELKFNCAEIDSIYNSRIKGKLGNFFAGHKLKKAEKIFHDLSVADAHMVNYLLTTVFDGLDGSTSIIKGHIDNGEMEKAETEKLRLKSRMNPTISELQKINSEMTNLILTFKTEIS